MMKRYFMWRLFLMSLIILFLASGCARDKKGLKKEEALIRFAAVGDVMLGRGVKRDIQDKGPEWPFLQVRSFLKERDLVYANLEMALDHGCQPLDKRDVFRMPVELLGGLTGSGINIYNLANDHTLDCGREALMQMTSWLTASGFHTVGAGQNQYQARVPVYVTHGGITVGILSFLTFPVEGIEYCEACTGPAFYDRETLIRYMDEMQKRADYRIVTFHWGSEYSLLPDNYQSGLAHEAVDFGADLVVGHGPHVLQSLERVRGKWIIYSLGNFVYDSVFPGGQEGAILCAEFRPGKMMNLRLLPVNIQSGQPAFMRGDSARKVLQAMIDRSDPGARGQASIVEDILYLK
jgi:poly-gamma-glutamate synthesis protein (capsule biosynthesis protein)